jgi:hypothetical protein
MQVYRQDSLQHYNRGGNNIGRLRRKIVIVNSMRGLTLTELLLAAVILAFTLAGILLLFINCMFLNEASRNLTIAVTHGQFALEEVKNTAFGAISSATWDEAIISSKGLTPLNTESISIGVGLIADPKDVTATVTWKDRGVRDRSLVLTTLISEP